MISSNIEDLSTELIHNDLYCFLVAHENINSIGDIKITFDTENLSNDNTVTHTILIPQDVQYYKELKRILKKIIKYQYKIHNKELENRLKG